MRRALYPDNIIVVSRKKAWGNLNRLLSCSVEAGQTQHVVCSTRGMAWHCFRVPGAYIFARGVGCLS